MRRAMGSSREVSRLAGEWDDQQWDMAGRLRVAGAVRALLALDLARGDGLLAHELGAALLQVTGPWLGLSIAELSEEWQVPADAPPRVFARRMAAKEPPVGREAWQIVFGHLSRQGQACARELLAGGDTADPRDALQELM
jgi:hypothetical protein